MLPAMPTHTVTTARLRDRPKTVDTKLITPSAPEYRFQSLILMVPATRISVPTQPVVEVMMLMMLLVRSAWASSTPTSAIRYSPSVTPIRVCLMTSMGLRLNRVMSGVITMPTMNPPATSVVPAARVNTSPGGCWLTSPPTSCLVSSLSTDQPASTRNAGTVRYAVDAIEGKQKTTTAVTANPK